MARKKRKKSPDNPRPVAASEVAEWARSQEFPEGTRYRVNAKGVPRMSAVLMDFAGPYLQGNEPIESYRLLMQTAAMAWNASFLPEAECRKARDEFANAAPGRHPADYAFALNLFGDMTRRRITEFGHIQRIVVEIDVDKGKDGVPRVNVASTPVTNSKNTSAQG